MKLSVAVFVFVVIVSGCNKPPDAPPGYYFDEKLIIQMQEDFDDVAWQEKESSPPDPPWAEKSFSELNIVFTLDDFDIWRFIAPNRNEIALPVYSLSWKWAVREFLRNKESHRPFSSGIFLSLRFIKHIEARYQEVKKCTGFAVGEFRKLAIWITLPHFHCSFKRRCVGLYISPNEIYLGQSNIAGHEFVHALLWQNTGEVDAKHRSPLFRKFSPKATD